MLRIALQRLSYQMVPKVAPSIIPLQIRPVSTLALDSTQFIKINNMMINKNMISKIGHYSNIFGTNFFRIHIANGSASTDSGVNYCDIFENSLPEDYEKIKNFFNGKN